MGMDLKPLNPSDNAPRDKDGEVTMGCYGWTGWTWLVDHLNEWGVDTAEFSGYNDGDEISAGTCALVADAIEAHLVELAEWERDWIKPHIDLWRTCGGYAQY